MTSFASRRKTHRLPAALSLFPDFEWLHLSALLPAPNGEPPPGPLYWPCRPWGRHHGPSLFPQFDRLTFSTGETAVPLLVLPLEAAPAFPDAPVVPLPLPVPALPDPAPLRTFSTGETNGQAIAPPEPVLSEAAQRLLDHLRDEGHLSVVTARHLLGRDPLAALGELQEAWRISEIPGGASSRRGRAASYRFVPQCAAHETLPLAYAHHVLAGKHGTLSAFIRWLAVSEAEVLAVMRGLIAAGLAQGGPVGATFAFRVSPEAVRVTPTAPTVTEMSSKTRCSRGPDRGALFMPTPVGGGQE